MPIEVERKILKWGNGYGIRLNADEVRALGLHAGSPVHAALQAGHASNELEKMTPFHFGGAYDVKAILEDEALGRR